MNISESQALQWAAGAPVDPPDMTRMDPVSLSHLLTHHKLEGRFLLRTQQQKQHFNRQLSFSLAKNRSLIRQQYERLLAAQHEITQACGTEGTPIVIKGISLYALTHNDLQMRYSGDLDVFHPDPECLMQILLRLGYQQIEKAIPQHEFAVLERAGVVVELHSYMPIESYPNFVTRDDCDPQNHPGLWRQPGFRFTRHVKLGYTDMLGLCVAGTAPGTEALTVPGPTLAVLLLCAHLFRHLIDKGETRLAEICDVRDLTRHPDFNAALFLRLAEQHQAQDALRFTALLERCYFGSQTLPRSASETEWKDTRRLTQRGRGFWIGLHSAEELLFSHRPDPPATLLDRLGANTVVMTDSEHQKHYAAPGSGSGKPIERLIQLADQDTPLPFTFSFFSTPLSLCCEIMLWESLPDDNCDYSVSLEGEQLSFRVVLRPGPVIQEAAGSGQASAVPVDNGSRLHLEIPWTTIPPARTLEGCLPLLLTVALRDWRLTHEQGYFDRWVTVPVQLKMS